MNSRNWVRLFLSTLLLGGISTAITGFIVRWDKYGSLFFSIDIMGILSVIILLFGVGLIFSIISQMGFFAYLTIHRFGLGIFRSVSLWNAVQIILIIFVLFDLVYFRYRFFAQPGENFISYVLVALSILIIGIAVAYIRKANANNETFVPALFFMTVVTIIEWVPALQINDRNWLYLMLFPLLVCNAYQLLVLPKLIARSQTGKKAASQVTKSK
ncbi:KinB-signaling pathway activation protein [Priestia abyssalis]|uniref:KinB-signaling pathway activation protein n=1 Tax=Priestia abyssalis TaxID=1221450 RepID=UPI0009950B98|nr:KinB-signaling pathway activation protein [Priestia abyssalis]